MLVACVGACMCVHVVFGECVVCLQALTAASLSIVSDVLAQSMTGASLSNLNYTSIRNQFIIGLLIRSDERERGNERTNERQANEREQRAQAQLQATSVCGAHRELCTRALSLQRSSGSHVV